METLEILKKQAYELIQGCDDLDLLDLVIKLLISQG
jgi:hypothetical protein